MQYEAELKFLKKLLMQFYLNMHLITKDNPLDEKIDNGLRKVSASSKTNRTTDSIFWFCSFSV